MKKIGILLFLACILFCSNIRTIKGCAEYFTFRAYLERTFWQPLSRYLPREPHQNRAKNLAPFAGTSAEGKSSVFQRVVDSYGAISQPIDPSFSVLNLEPQRLVVSRALKEPHLSDYEKEELNLLDCKIDMREGESGKRAMLERAKVKFRMFVKSAKHPALASEARGWLARVHFLLGEYSGAAKIYLDELNRNDSNLDARTLVTSLHILFPYNGSSARLADHMEEYFDTPEHALFVVNLVTNPVYSAKERQGMGSRGKEALRILEKHRDLFRSGNSSNSLVLASMRAALYMGDPEAALRYSARISAHSHAKAGFEYNWMLGIIYFLRHEYASAEAPLLKILNSPKSTDEELNAAAQGLVGVYQKLKRPVDQLHAAFYYPMDKETGRHVSYEDQGAMPWPYWGQFQDLSYLLDVQLTDEELIEYLQRYPNSVGSLRITFYSYRQERMRSSVELTKYALAVRYARHEQYEASASLYESIQAWPRAKRMSELAALYRKSTDPALSREERSEALFQYAAFLNDHPNGIFFNNTLWFGWQRRVFLDVEQFPDEANARNSQGLTKAEREAFLQMERKLRDNQEERWRAAKILMGIVRESKQSDISRRAAKRALTALNNINIVRFGREREIQSAIQEMKQWLKCNS
jgi:hypothetical protein